MDADTLQALNPALRAAVWRQQRPVPRGYRLRIPGNMQSWTGDSLAAKLAGAAAASVLVAAAPTPTPTRTPTPAPAPAMPPPVEATLAALPSGGGPSTRGRSAAAVAAAAAAYEAMYVVRDGDSLAAIALRTGVEPEQLIIINRLRDGEHIYEGQRLELVAGSPHAAANAVLAAQALADDREESVRVNAASAHPEPVVSGAQAQAQGPALLADAGAPASADPIDYSVDANGSVVVVAAETIGHYADWLDVPATTLRALNGMHGRSAMLIGRHFKLAFTRVPRAQFEERRRDYHRQLQAEYFAAHRITGSDLYVARRGDSLWTVTQRGAMPVWLLQQYNPDVDFAVLRPGTQIVLPKVEDVIT